jgi:hypothetical protein
MFFLTLQVYFNVFSLFHHEFHQLIYLSSTYNSEFNSSPPTLSITAIINKKKCMCTSCCICVLIVNQQLAPSYAKETNSDAVHLCVLLFHTVPTRLLRIMCELQFPHCALYALYESFLHKNFCSPYQ